jgi:hypothetical protein
MLGIYMLSGGVASTTYADDTRTQSNMYQQNILYYDIASSCGSIGEIDTSSTNVSLSSSEAANAQTIIGIAKTDNVGQAGALIGLMVGLTESGLKDYANSTVPLSLTNPNAQAVGDNGASLGVFQQQITDNWSTISSDPNNAAAVNQLMTPSYEAEAFFGSPPNSNANSALSKGLLNVSGWQNMSPWLAAQAVQRSAYSDGSNYEAELSQAQSLLSQYYSSAPAIALPVALNTQSSSSNSSTAALECTSSTKCQNGATGDALILCAALKYNGIYYEYGGGHGGRAAFVAACPDPSHPPAYPPNVPYGSKLNPPISVPNDGNPNACATDCSGLVSMAVDDAFDQQYDWVVSDIVSNGNLPAGSTGKVWAKVSSYAQAQPGDVVTRHVVNPDGTVDDHVEIFVSYNASSDIVTTFGSHTTGKTTGTAPPTSGTYYNTGIYHYIGPQGTQI